jgi:hemin uptake protein HemP
MTSPKPPHLNTNAAAASPAAGQAPRTVDSHELLGPNGVLYIRHQNEVYRLQTTRFGKLILTK